MCMFVCMLSIALYSCIPVCCEHYIRAYARSSPAAAFLGTVLACGNEKWSQRHRMALPHASNYQGIRNGSTAAERLLSMSGCEWMSTSEMTISMYLRWCPTSVKRNLSGFPRSPPPLLLLVLQSSGFIGENSS